jgi:hypothetical protein
MKTLFGMAVIAFFGSAMVLAMDYAASLPDVHISYATGNCVAVTTYQGVFFDSLGYNCENMPVKYNHVWAE